MPKETSPRELWLLIKNIAESNVINISNRCSRGASLHEWHQQELANLSSLLKEKVADHP